MIPGNPIYPDRMCSPGSWEGPSPSSEQLRYRDWINANAGGKLYWDSWQRRVVEVPDPSAVWDERTVLRDGLRVINIHDNWPYQAKWSDLRKIDNPLEAIALAAAAS